MMPLNLAAIGEENMILKVGGNAEVKAHLESMGFVPGGSIWEETSLSALKIPAWQ